MTDKIHTIRRESNNVEKEYLAKTTIVYFYDDKYDYTQTGSNIEISNYKGNEEIVSPLVTITKQYLLGTKRTS